MSAWASKEDARTHWADAATMDDTLLDQLLNIANEQLLEYAPVLAVGDPVPARYMLATVLQAKELREAGDRAGDVIGFGDYAVRARPITATVKALLRPPRSGLVMG